MSDEQSRKSPKSVKVIAFVLLFLIAITIMFVILLDTDDTIHPNKAVDPTDFNVHEASTPDCKIDDKLSSTGEDPPCDENSEATITKDSHYAATPEPSIEQVVEPDEETSSNLSILEGRAFAFGDPQENVKIRLTHQTGSLYVAGEKYATSSDVDGYYSFEDLPQGSYLLHGAYSCDDGAFSDSHVVDIDRRVVERDLHIAECIFSEIKGHIFEGSAPITGIRVMLDGNRFTSGKLTDKSGFFHFAKVPPGFTRLEITIPEVSYKYQKAYSLKGGNSIHERIDIQNGECAISGRILVDGKPLGIGFIEVTQITSPDTAALYEVTGVHNGDWFIEGLPEGEYAVTLSGPRKVTKHAVVSSEEETKVDFHLQMGDASIEGLLIATGVKLNRNNRKVYLFFPDTCTWKKGDSFRLPTTSDGLFAESSIKTNNRYSFGRLEANTFDLVAIYYEHGRIEKVIKERVEVLKGDDLNLNLTFP